MTYRDEDDFSTVYDPEETISPQDRIRELEEELEGKGADPKEAIMKLARNPGLLKERFNLTENQAQNVCALITGSLSGASAKYLGKQFGYEIAGALGGALGGFLARKLFG